MNELADQLQSVIEDLGALRYEMTLMGGALLLLVVGLFVSNDRLNRVLFALTLIGAAMVIPWEQGWLLHDVLQMNNLTHVLKLLFAVVGVWVVFYHQAVARSSEYYFLLLAMVLGSVIMMQANHLLVVYLAIELTSFSGYLLTNLDYRKSNFESGIKYLLFGGTSSAIALYGISLIYGLTGSMNLGELTMLDLDNSLLLLTGSLAFMVGILFKISLIPFHIWVPSTYQEAPTSTVAILSTIPKIAGFVLLHQVMIAMQWLEVPAIRHLLLLFGIGTIVMGTLGALRQTEIKRLLAYGAIAHSGFLMVPLLFPGPMGITVFIWYAIVYLLMNMALFYLVSYLEKSGIKHVDDLSGIGGSIAWVSIPLLIVLLSLIGLPPTAGFTAKLLIFTLLWDGYSASGDHLLLVYLGVGVMSVLFSLYFYLKIPYYMFLKDRLSDITIEIDITTKLLATIWALVLLWLFFSPNILNNIADNIKFLTW